MKKHISSFLNSSNICILEQTSMPVPGTSRPRNALCASTSSASTAGATTRATATRTSCPWTTASRAFWGSAWNCPRTSKWTTTCGWSGRSSPNLFHGKNCYSENPQLSVRSSDKDLVITDRRIIITLIIHVLYSWKCSQMWIWIIVPLHFFKWWTLVTFLTVAPADFSLKKS